MKKVVAVLFMLALLLTGCGKKDQTAANTNDHTISDGTYTYEYTDTVEGDVRTITIHYPDGGTYTWTQESHIGFGSENYGPDADSFTDGYTLVETILGRQTADKPEHSGLRWVMIFAGILIAGYGLWHVCRPMAVWNIYMRHWFQEDPGEYALTRIISGGIGGIIIGIAMILIGIFVY